MDLSPVWISLKTSVVSIIITFFLGLWAARGVVSVRSTKAKAWLDGLLTLPLVLTPTVWSKKTGRYLFRKSISL